MGGNDVSRMAVLANFRRAIKAQTGNPMKRFLFLMVLGLLVAGTGKGQTVLCSGQNKDCAHKAEITQIIGPLPAPADWTVVSISSHQVWVEFCEWKCDIPAQTNLQTRRTYLDTERIYAKSASAGLRAYLAHELGHILTNSTSEKIADNKAKELLKN